MKITGISLTPPPAAAGNPSLQPELLAAVLARYSRSNDGLQNILGRIDPAKQDDSVDRILKFADYGHASIGGLTGGIPLVLDGVSMWLAYLLFSLSPMADGQESSTRYIKMDATSLPDWVEFGFTPAEAAILQDWALLGLDLYKKCCERLDAKIKADPSLVKIPEALASKPAAIARLHKNFALDRCRYLLPFALKTNCALIQSARMWAETLCGLYAYADAVPEAAAVAEKLKAELAKYAPRLIHHARPKNGWKFHTRVEMGSQQFQTIIMGHGDPKQANLPTLSVFTAFDDADIAIALSQRENRYDRCGLAARDSVVRVAWPQISLAELRDLNRHRTGSKFSPLSHDGFFLPPETAEVIEPDEATLWSEKTQRVRALGRARPELAHYTRSLGSLTSLTHTMQLDKFAYTAELRTGAGAHFAYAHLWGQAVKALAAAGFPLTAGAINVGTAEPE